jgi:hypothetical protein
MSMRNPTSNTVMVNNHVTVYSTSQPMYINSHTYYFGHSNYHSQPSKIRCSARLEDFTKNTVPFNTTFSNSTADVSNQTQQLDDPLKGNSTDSLDTSCLECQMVSS